jgi:porphobilinogen synthase
MFPMFIRRRNIKLKSLRCRIFRRSIDLTWKKSKNICFSIRAVNIYVKVSENLKTILEKKLGIKDGLMQEAIRAIKVCPEMIVPDVALDIIYGHDGIIERRGSKRCYI